MIKEYIHVKIPEYDICVYLNLPVLYHVYVGYIISSRTTYIDIRNGVKYLSPRIVKLADEQLEECDSSLP